jgi:hypothetical protein
MRNPTSIMHGFIAVVAVLMGATACATSPVVMDAAALQAYAGKPWDKARLMNSTVELGRYHEVPVVAEFPCSDVCPQYTARIIHYRLPPGASCASVGGVEKQLLVPVAITVLPKMFCIPQPLVESAQYYVR